jgi:hypothetical protein
MGRQMWPYDATWKYSVRGTPAQTGPWEWAARLKGVKVPVFLAMAGDFYAEHLKRQLAEDEA